MAKSRGATASATAVAVARHRSREACALGVYVAVVVATMGGLVAGQVLGFVRWPSVTAPNWQLLCLLTAAVVALESWKTDLFGDSKLTLTVVPIFGGALLLGPGSLPGVDRGKDSIHVLTRGCEILGNYGEIIRYIPHICEDGRDIVLVF